VSMIVSDSPGFRTTSAHGHNAWPRMHPSYWEDRFYTPPPPPPPESNFWDCSCARIETRGLCTPPPLGGGGVSNASSDKRCLARAFQPFFVSLERPYFGRSTTPRASRDLALHGVYDLDNYPLEGVCSARVCNTSRQRG
jgi:hypothetical protein